MPTLRVKDAVNPPDEIGYGALELDVRDAGRVAVEYRLAQHPSDLQYAHWRPVTADIETIPRQFAAFQHQGPSLVVAEVKFDTGSNVIVSAAEHCYARTTPGLLRPFEPVQNPAAGYLVRVRPTNDRNVWPMVQYGEPSSQSGNNFMPFDVHSDGYAWCTENVRQLDIGEVPQDIILAHAYSRHFDPFPNTWNFAPSSTTLVAVLGSDGLDLKGAICVWAVLCAITSGPHTGKHARYHLLEPLTFGSGSSFHTNQRVFPSGSHANWRCSFASDNAPLNAVPSGPSFTIEAIELILRLPESGGLPVNLTNVPTGLIKIKEFAVKQ